MNRVPLLAAAVRHIKALPSRTDRQRFLRALRYSVGDDSRTPPRIYGPDKIASLTSIAIHTQYQFNIVLDRKRAIAFLESLHSKPGPEAFRKKLSAANYRKMFGKHLPAKHRNSYVFTYQEILLIEGLRLKLELPPEI